MKTKYFEAIMDKVSELTEVSREEMLSKRRTAEIVEARVLAISYLHDFGFTNRFIRETFNVSDRRISEVISECNMKNYSVIAGVYRRVLKDYCEKIAKQALES